MKSKKYDKQCGKKRQIGKMDMYISQVKDKSINIRYMDLPNWKQNQRKKSKHMGIKFTEELNKIANIHLKKTFLVVGKCKLKLW